ncbi:MAG: hypothetical protein KC657_07130 [Myxococcales bacterium]|nr:hypothetical protein [Myxococcales bacterium]
MTRARLAPFALVTVTLIACGGENPSPQTPNKTPKAVAVTPPAPPPDLTQVPEPKSLFIIGRVKKPEDILKTAGAWTRLPLPSSSELVRLVSDEGMGDIVDLSQPVDGAIAILGRGNDPQPAVAVSVALKGLEQTKTALARSGRKTRPGPNGQVFVEMRPHGDDEDESDEICSIAPAVGPGGGRMVCGDRSAVEALTPYLTRTAPRLEWPADVHAEVRLSAVRDALEQFKSSVSAIQRGLLRGAPPSMRAIADAALTDVVDLSEDVSKLTLDAQISPPGATATVNVEYARKQSFVAKVATANADKVDVPPAAFWHLPQETDLAFFTRGSDPKAFERPKALLGDLLQDAITQTGMPSAEGDKLRSLLMEKAMPLLIGPVVYGKGHNQAALEKALAAHKALRDKDGKEDLLAEDAARTAVGTQIVGWHVARVEEPIARTGPMLKEWAQLVSRPGFVKWAKERVGMKTMPTVKAARLPAAVVLPKDTVHIEITIPRTDLSDWSAPVPKGGKRKTFARKPIVLHVYGAPDAGATWLGFGLDNNLVAHKVSESLSTSPELTSLGRKAGGLEPLRAQKVSGALFGTMRGLFVVASDSRRRRNPYEGLAGLPGKGNVPIWTTYTAKAPSPGAAGGTGSMTLTLSREAIEDIVKFAMMAR